MTSNERKPQIMEPTITQNGALFALQHRAVKYGKTQQTAGISAKIGAKRQNKQIAS